MQLDAAQHSLLGNYMSDHKDTTNWPELAIGLYDRLTGRQAEIAYAFEDFSVDIPSSTAADACGLACASLYRCVGGWDSPHV